MNSKIRIHRKKELKSSVRKVKIEANGREIGIVRNGEIKDLIVEPGNYYLKATLDGVCTSNSVEFDLKENETIEFHLSHKKGIALINMLFHSKNYFLLEKIIK